MDELQIIVSLQSLEIFQENNIKQLDYGHPKGKVKKNTRYGFLKNKSRQARLIPFFAVIADLQREDKY